MNPQDESKKNTSQKQPSSEPVITSVWATTWNTVLNTYRMGTIVVVVLSVMTVFLHPFFPFVLFGIYVSIVFGMAHGMFMQQFAKVNNFTYKKTISLDKVSGRLFKVGHSRSITHAVLGTYQNHPLKLFNYSYTIGSGKHSRTYAFTVAEIVFEQTSFPHILLRSNTMSRYGTTDSFGSDKDVRISLEDAFAKNFTLYCTQDYEIEVLQIFTSEFLSYLESTASNFSIEFAENSLYIYDDRTITTKKDLDEMLGVLRNIFDRRGELLNRLHDDFKVLHETYK